MKTDNNIARKNSVTELSQLYNVVIGVALSLAIYNLIDTSRNPLPINWDIALNFLTYLALVVPFYHGAIRHLFATYVEDGGSSRIRNGALLTDFFLLFIEGCAFVMMASLISNTIAFTHMILFLLILDTVWGFLAYLAFTGAGSQYAEKQWAIINFIASAFISIFIISYSYVPNMEDIHTQIVIFVIIFCRTIADYSKTWSFYFPRRIDKAKPEIPS